MRRLAIVGATATGKTSLAVALARRLGEVSLISVDAMAVYRGLDIGTAKPDRRERHGVEWHLISVVPPNAEFSVATFQEMAHRAIGTVEGAGRTPVLVGGTGLYHRSVIDDLEIPPNFPGLRVELEGEAVLGEAAVRGLHDRLVHLDRAAASKTEPTNARRIVRALEVTIGSGRPFSSFGPGLTQYQASPWTIIGLELDRPVLDARITERLDRQLRAGFIDETAGLLARPGRLSRTARQALGYREIIEHLGGRYDVATMREATLTRTRSFARRQESWFRRDPRIIWLDARRRDLIDAVAALATDGRL